MNPSGPIPNPVEQENSPLRSDDAAVRPVGVLQPDDPVARRVMVALADRRTEDAEGHLRRMRGGASMQTEAPGEIDASTRAGAQAERTGVERIWTFVLEGLVAEAKGRFGEAERWFRAAATVHEFDPRIDPRVRALAFECLGRVLRRMDDLVRAGEAHRASLDIRERVGSWEECRQSAHELALDSSVAGKHGDAIAWHCRAMEFADAIGDAGLFLRAETLSHLARVQRDAGGLDAAIQYAQENLDLRKRLDPSSLETLRAALELVECRIAHAGESGAIETSMTPAEATGLERSVPHPRWSEDGATTLDATIAQLSGLREEFLAWGVGVEDERQRCEEALDFARRLRESSATP